MKKRETKRTLILLSGGIGAFYGILGHVPVFAEKQDSLSVIFSE